MRRLFRLSVLGGLGVLSAFGPAGAQGKTRVVATLPDLWAITREITGDVFRVEVATRFGQNPHDLEIRPSQILLVKRADVLVRNGLEEDAWIDPIVEGSGNPRLLRGSPNVIEVAHGIPRLKVPAGQVDRSLGDVHPSGNPHFDLDPANLPAVTANIVAGLSRVAPDFADRFEANRRVFLEKVASAERQWRQMLAPHRRAKLVSYHDSWPYFHRAFGFEEVGIIEDRPGVPPSPQHLTALIRKMRQEKVRVILLESWYPPDMANFVARETGARVLVLPQTPGAVPGTEDYISHLDYLVRAIVQALEDNS